MKKIATVVICLLIFQLQTLAQIHDPVKWQTSVEKISDTEYKLISRAAIDPGWHLYAQDVPEDGPLPTTFTYDDENGAFKIIGNTTEEEGHTVADPVFEMNIKYFENSAVFEQQVEVLGDKTKLTAFVEYMVCDDSKCLPPNEVTLTFLIPNATTESRESLSHNVEGHLESAAKKVSKTSEKRGLFAVFFIAFISGFAALLTPCVFPLIPMTVSFFTKQSKSKAAGIKNAVFYGLSIVIIYVLLGSLVSLIFGADALNAFATNVWFNIIFFLLLLVFAASFLGAFELTLPHTWANKVDRQADKGGFIGIFFMALALAIVSFSCTGPIVGTLLVEAASGGSQVGPVVGMLGFSLALAIPFALFAAFPGWLNSLPKSGGWLNSVKVVLGFLELALAFKFLSNADLVLQLHWLEREAFIAIWIAIFGALTLYLFGKIRMPHDSPATHLSVGRLSLALLSCAFTLYMIPGLWGAPLNLISAFPPPQHYSESPYGVGHATTGAGSEVQGHEALPDGGHLMPPHNILAFNDYDKGLAYAKKIDKPVMIDFTGHACVNCRKMEQNVWVKPKVLDILKNKVVLISLYVDDKRKLAAGETVDSKLKPGRKLKYIGQKWSELQTIKYKTNSQPFYVLMGHNEENLVDPVAYTPDVDEYYNWLMAGLGNFR